MAALGRALLAHVAELWGLAALSVREIRQIIMGNQLLLFSLRILVHLFLCGGFGAIEHPAEPDNPLSASIWRTELIGLLMRLPGFERHQFAQGLMGARSAKPTGLLALNLPTMRQCLHASRICSDLPRASSIGKATTGHWNTMPLKEYPPSLCRALAMSFASAASELEVDAEVCIDQEFWGHCRTMIVDKFDQCLGPDYAP